MPQLPVRVLFLQPHVCTVCPHLRQLLRIPSPTKHVVAGQEPRRHEHVVHYVPYSPKAVPPEAISTTVGTAVIAAVSDHARHGWREVWSAARSRH
eukprot:6735776-Prymnesium_polylepis.1